MGVGLSSALQISASAHFAAEWADFGRGGEDVADLGPRPDSGLVPGLRRGNDQQGGNDSSALMQEHMEAVSADQLTRRPTRPRRVELKLKITNARSGWLRLRTNVSGLNCAMTLFLG
jgi:hypothetical protein